MRSLGYIGIGALLLSTACAEGGDQFDETTDGSGNGSSAGGSGGSGGSGSGGACTTAAECDDGDACTDDACSEGSCVAIDVDIDDDDACTSDACDSTTGVSHDPVEVDDGDACTDDSCDPMSGVQHLPTNPDDNDVCTDDNCDPLTGPVHTPIPVDDMELCTIDSCDPATGPVFLGEQVVFEEDFSDNNAGWTLDIEWQIGPTTTSSGQSYAGADPAQDHTPTADNGVAGVVIGGNASTTPHAAYYLTSPVVNAAGLPASAKLELRLWRWLNSDYANYMINTVEVYNGAIWQPLWTTGSSPGVEDAPPVGDGWFPMSFDITAYAQAALQIRVGVSTTSGVYTVSSWNVDDVAIVTVPVATDLDQCTQLSCVSMSGAQFTLLDVNDNDPCTTDSCSTALGIRHDAPPIDDGNACTIDSCDATGVHHDPVNVDDGDACTADGCDPFFGVFHDPLAEDNNVCTIDYCDATGVHNDPIDVDDGDPCTTDGCDPINGPTHTPLDCNDSDACTTDACDATGACVHAPLPTPAVFFEEGFADNSQGWTLGNEWQIGAAVAGPPPVFPDNCADPGQDTSPSADNGVAGVQIGGCSPSSVSKTLHAFYFLTSPSIDASAAAGTLYLHFNRWLLSDYTPYMNSVVEVSSDGVNFTRIWENALTGVYDTSWQDITHDITAFKSATMRVRFGFDVGSSGVYSVGSWTLDEVFLSDSNSTCH